MSRPNYQVEMRYPYHRHYEPITEQKFKPCPSYASRKLLELGVKGPFYEPSVKNVVVPELAKTICGQSTSTSSSTNRSHKDYFEQLELRKINVLSKNKVATRPPEPVRIVRSEVKEPPIESLEWESIRKRPTAYEAGRRFIVNCRVVEARGNLCECEQPCRWAKRWIHWTKQPKADLYYDLAAIPVRPQTKVQIEKDLRRTQPTNKSFQEERILNMLGQMLQTYSKYDQEVDYVQGMNLVASVLLYHIKDPQRSFWVFVDLMEVQELKQIYIDDFTKLKAYIHLLLKLIKYKINDLHQHFQMLEVEMEHVAYGWFLSLMCNVVPLELSHLVIDKFISRGWIGLFSIILSYLIYLKQELLMSQEATDILARFSSNNSADDVDWETVIVSSQSIHFTKDQINSMIL